MDFEQFETYFLVNYDSESIAILYEKDDQFKVLVTTLRYQTPQELAKSKTITVP